MPVIFFTDQLHLTSFFRCRLRGLWLKRTALVIAIPLAAALSTGNASAAAKTITFSSASPGLSFGRFVILSSCSNCTITMSTSGVRTASSGVVLLNSASGSAAAFAATGTSCGGGCTYVVTTPSPGTVAISAGSVTMTVGSYTYSQSAPSTPNTLFVGATLTIPSSGATPGLYSSGSYTVTTTP